MKTAFLSMAAMAAGLTMAQGALSQTLPGKGSPRMGILSGPPVSCTGLGDCPVPVTVSRGTSAAGTDFCQVTLAFETHVGIQILKKIVWTLSPVMIGDATYSFQPDYGVLILKDGGRQISRSGLGDGGMGTVWSYQYYAYHLRNRKNDDVTYLPIVMQTVPSTVGSGDPVVTLCGASDPKIIND